MNMQQFKYKFASEFCNKIEELENKTETNAKNKFDNFKLNKEKKKRQKEEESILYGINDDITLDQIEFRTRQTLNRTFNGRDEIIL